VSEPRPPRGLRDLVGEDVPAAEVEALEQVDALLRTVSPPPAHVPASLTGAIASVPLEKPRFGRRRLVLAIAVAVALAAGFFGLGRWTEGDGFDTRLAIPMEATADARGATALIRVGARDEETGNWQLELETSGLPKLPPGGYYDLWLAKDGEYAASCGTFRVGDGKTTIRMNVSYRLRDYDTWVVTARTGDRESPWLLKAEI
jgi:hypothetical protein